MIRTKYLGRSGNIIFQNIGTSIISQKFDLKVSEYAYPDHFRQLGLKLFDGKRVFTDFKKVTDDGIDYGDNYSDMNSQNRCLSLIDVLNSESINYGIYFEGFFQVREFIESYSSSIKSHFNLTYQEVNKKSVFVHVRLGDVDYRNPGFKYYQNCLESISFDDGYISSDSFGHPIVTKLMNDYKLKPFMGDPITTINFAKDFNNLVLSQGTFSWWVGFLSKAENIFWPDGGEKWHGDIFIFDDWKPIKFENI